ncbi:hypothetical protein BIZ71_gp51 [Gordonia phage Hedwig]|uniref:Uncharacterized protein n=1 Tax=Gordonia phage Hedwig TaxID=1887648 RepID=A0A1C9EHS0_9CAUD|nr:hypothetical protein BIZ71_gp51 [Gordonia phage Hedwig]AON97344.1 hypothetical protein SEA_HEDWIG_51 [Gordonia phage Hedwig]
MSAKTNPLLQSLLAQSRGCRRDERHNPRCKRCARGRRYASVVRGVS